MRSISTSRSRKSLRHLLRRRQGMSGSWKRGVPSSSRVELFLLGLGLVLAALVWTWLSWEA